MFEMNISLPSDVVLSTVEGNFEAARKILQDFLTKIYKNYFAVEFGERKQSHDSLYLSAEDRYGGTRIKLTEEDFLLLCITLVTLQ